MSTLKNTLLLLLLFIFQFGYAQKGDYLLSHYTLDVEGLDNLNFELKVNNDGQLCIANRSGVLLYEGNNWDFESTPSAALSVDFDSLGVMYVGCAGDFGRFGFEAGQYKFISLNPNKSDESLYFKTVVKDTSVFFISESDVIRYHTNQKKSYLTYLEDPDEYFTNLFEVDDQIMVQTNKKIYRYHDDSLLSDYDWKLPENAEFLFFDKHPTRKQYVAGTTDNKVYIYRNKKFYECKMSKFLIKEESFVNNGVWVDKDHFALSTLEDGIILYSNRNSKIVDVINHDNGLPDNEIYTIGRDHEGGLWISHEFGLSRLEIGVPFRSFTNYHGLEGNLKDIFWFGGHLYVSTSKGVFFLEKKQNYKNTVYYVPVKGSAAQKPTSTSTKKTKKGMSLFGKKKGPTSGKSSTQTRSVKYVRKVKKDLINSGYEFTKIEGIEAKCEKFIRYQKKLLVASANGLYEIKKEYDKKAKEYVHEAELVVHEPIRFTFIENHEGRLVIANHYNEIKLYTHEDEIWVEEDQIDFHGELVLSALHQHNGITWFATPSHLYRYDSLSSTYHDFREYKYHNQFIDEVRIAAIDNQLYLINSIGYFYLDGAKDKIFEDTTLMKRIGRPIKHLQEHGGKVWVNNGENWYQINRNKSVIKREIFGLFPDMSLITNYRDNIWLINDSRELLKYYPSQDDSLIWSNHMYFREAKSNKGDVNINIHGPMAFEHDENSFYFELARPDYRGLLQVEYQHKLSGQVDKWSEWTTNNQINLNYLPPNNYTLDIRSRDHFGQIQELESVKFVINPPYWQTLWFYGLQILFMTGLVVGSVIMNRKAQQKYVIVTEGLTILTIVMVIEFLQTVAGGTLGIESTPVVDFGIDVVIALCVFPLEQTLKKLMKVSKQGPGLNGKAFFDLFKSSKPATATVKS
ncbi:MAG: two-component regulator propeller domain-containing protein [Reichenbachiella sp.]|uniref:two-component regulator propeller domain-containing protein n=1 Tax=Reichenbachiella sp. TaxID=2184521 RepID=UPI003296AF00